jgi:hypothetical protein
MKLARISQKSMYKALGTYKNPVLTPQLDTGALLIISGVQKLNIIATRFEEARAHPAVRARKRCCGTSAA